MIGRVAKIVARRVARTIVWVGVLCSGPLQDGSFETVGLAERPLSQHEVALLFISTIIPQLSHISSEEVCWK